MKKLAVAYINNLPHFEGMTEDVFAFVGFTVLAVKAIEVIDYETDYVMSKIREARRKRRLKKIDKEIEESLEEEA